jgi:HSP20 family protein
MDAYRKGDTFFIMLDLPGTSLESIDLTVEQSVLTVHAQRTAVEDDVEMIVAERPSGTFTRQVFLGDTLDADNIAADYTAGVLTLRIPVREEAKPRKVTISSKDTPAITAG